jgi:hypothetical protein
MTRASFVALVGGLSLGWGRSASAGELTAEVEPQGIYGGQPAGACEWPAAVSLGSCTATLVHPQVIVYAAHCGAGYSSVFIGDDTDGPGYSVPTQRCETYPGFSLGNGNDWAYCVLAQPIDDVPYTPPLMGCEVDVLTPGRDVWLVGFGDNDDGGYGTKYEAQAAFNQFNSAGEANIGGNGTTICYGDSGGPAFVQLPESEGFDGTWRAFGIASYIYSPCGNEGFHVTMHSGMEWIESSAGIDITPCHDADGTWNPSEDCRGFPRSADTASGSWNTVCEHGDVGGWGATCGASWAELVDDEPPTVRFVDPTGGSIAADASGNATFLVELEADDGDGAGVVTVELSLDGQPVGGVDTSPPWLFELTLPEGTYTLSAAATDDAANVGHADAMILDVHPDGAPPPNADDWDEPMPGDGGSNDTLDGDDDRPGLPYDYGFSDEEPGCACASTPARGRASWVWWSACLWIVARRRRG